MQTKGEKLGFILLLIFCVVAITIVETKIGIVAILTNPENISLLEVYGLGGAGIYISIERLING